MTQDKIEQELEKVRDELRNLLLAENPKAFDWASGRTLGSNYESMVDIACGLLLSARREVETIKSEVETAKQNALYWNEVVRLRDAEVKNLTEAVIRWTGIANGYESDIELLNSKLETMKSELSSWIDKCNTLDGENVRLIGTIRSLTETIEAHVDRVRNSRRD